ncbi:MAG: phage tail tape measure protein [Acidobacteria bacterium]|nr:phage tail tape measure protein [Acidobacteriota bacterium]
MGDGLVIGLGSKLGAAVAKSKEFIDGMLGALASKIREVTAAAPTMGDLFKLFDDPKYAKGLATLAKEMGYTVDELKEFLKIAQQRDEFTALFDTMDRAMRGAGRGGGSERGTGEGDGLTLPGNGADEFANLLVIVPQATAAWTNFFDTFAARIAEMRDSLSNTNELIGETFIDSLSQIGDVFANAVTQWDGTAQGFFRSLAQGFAQMAKQIIADLIRIAVMQAVLKIAGLVGGGLSQSAPGWTSGSSASVIPGVGAGGATAGARVFAEGGYTGSGAKHEPAGIVHRGEFVMPMESVKALGSWVDGILAEYADAGRDGIRGSKRDDHEQQFKQDEQFQFYDGRRRSGRFAHTVADRFRGHRGDSDERTPEQINECKPLSISLWR